jgi:hypothetical protein
VNEPDVAPAGRWLSWLGTTAAAQGGHPLDPRPKRQAQAVLIPNRSVVPYRLQAERTYCRAAPDWAI